MADLTDDMLTQRLRAALKLEANQPTPPWWSPLVTDAVSFARGEVRSRLVARGYSASQITQWERLEEFGKDIGLWHLLLNGGLLEAYPELEKLLPLLDRRTELDTVVLLSPDGEHLHAEIEHHGLVGHGRMKNNADLVALDETTGKPKVDW